MASFLKVISDKKEYRLQEIIAKERRIDNIWPFRIHLVYITKQQALSYGF
jgi:hypothetical protein